MISVYFIRHAESMGNVNNHIIGGRSNHYPLSKRGEIQARLLGERLLKEEIRFDHIFSSVAVRARETARIACGVSEQPSDNIVMSEDLVELSQGEWEGKIRKEYYTQEMKSALFADPHNFKPPGGESQLDVENRMFSWLQQTLNTMENPSGDLSIAAFSHGFAIKSLLRKILDSSPKMTYRTIIHNTSITGIRIKDERWMVERINDFSHLAGTEIIDHY